MIIGTFRYGRVDRVPGRFYVATQFIHFCFLPLIPAASYLLEREDLREPQKFQGINIPMSLKSVLLTWGRTLLFLFVVMTLWQIWNGNEIAQARWPWTAGAAVLFLASLFYWPKANFRRAIQLGIAAGVPPQTIAQEYGCDVPDAETLAQLERELKPLTEDGKPGVGPAGKFFGGLLMFLPGAWITHYGINEVLESGRKGYDAAGVFSLIMLFGLGLGIVGVSMWSDCSKKTRKWMYLAALGIALATTAFGPTLSEWYLSKPPVKG